MPINKCDGTFYIFLVEWVYPSNLIYAVFLLCLLFNLWNDKEAGDCILPFIFPLFIPFLLFFPFLPSFADGSHVTHPTQMHQFNLVINLLIFYEIGFPKVVPPPGTVTTTQNLPSRRQSRALECLVPPRTGSFRQRTSPVHHPAPQDRPPLAFCKRRLSWPEVDPRSTSG